MTSEELASQGLDEESFSRLDERAKDFVVKRALFYRAIVDRTLAAELLTVMASEVRDKKLITDVLEGKSQRGATAVRIIIADFKRSGMQAIKEYYNRFYLGKAEQILTGILEKPPVGDDEAPKASAIPTTPAKLEEKAVVSEKAVQPPKPAQDLEIEEIIKPTAAPSSPKKSKEDRIKYVAAEVSKWVNMPVEKVMAVEDDLVERIIAFTDLNADKGFTEEDVCRACDAMLKEPALGINFPLEILASHKDELLDRILKERVG